MRRLSETGRHHFERRHQRAAYVTEARKEALALDAVTNFCRPFAFDDPDKPHTGIAFLIVCDMLLTGFDAPIEQVMYLDKKISGAHPITGDRSY